MFVAHVEKVDKHVDKFGHDHNFNRQSVDADKC